MAGSCLEEEEEEETRSIHTHLSPQLVWMDSRRGKEGREGGWVRNKERGREKEGKDREEEGMVINCHSWAGCSPTKHISAVKQLILIMHVKGTTLLHPSSSLNPSLPHPSPPVNRTWPSFPPSSPSPLPPLHSQHQMSQNTYSRPSTTELHMK